MIKKKDMTRYENAAKDRINYLIDTYCDGSQQRFSERTGLNKGSLSQDDHGKKIPSNITASKIADIFHINPAWLMGFDVPMDRKTPDLTTSSSYDLLPDEASLIDNYRSLNLEGKKEVDKHMKYIVSQEEYIKDTSVSESVS